MRTRKQQWQIEADQKATCANREAHYEPGIPDGYLARQEWFRQMSRAWKQTKCPVCGLWCIWIPKMPTKVTHKAG